jgi:hypothetical protein
MLFYSAEEGSGIISTLLWLNELTISSYLLSDGGEHLARRHGA